MADPNDRSEDTLRRDPATTHALDATPTSEDTASFSAPNGVLPTPTGTKVGSSPSTWPDTFPPSGVDLPCNFGDYDLLSELGRGGMGVVYKARHKSLDRLVALKMIGGRALPTDHNRQRLGLEARAAAALDHPHIVPVFEVGEFAGFQYFTMAFVDGDTLAGYVPPGGLPVAEAVRILQLVADALEHVHKNGIIHRDLKPSNILLDRDGRPRVSDFGLAKQLNVDGGLTGSGQLLGTPSYMSPEQALGGAKSTIGPAADIYALGGVLYHALTGVAPVTGESYAQMLLKVVQEPPTPVRTLRPSVPAELEVVCLKCLAKKPEERYPSAAAVAQALRRLAAHTPSTADMLMPCDFSIGPPSATAAPPPPTLPPPTSPAPPAAPRSFPIVPVACVAVLALVLLAGSLLLAPYLPKAAAVPATSAPAEAFAEFPTDWDILDDPARTPRHDFNLKVEIVGGTAEANGEQSLKNGREISLRIESDKDATVGVWMVRPDGKKTQLFPNDFEPDNKLVAGKVRTIPGTDQYALALKTSQMAERLFVVASTKPWNSIEGQKEGPFVAFRSPQEIERFNGQFRDIVVKPTHSVASVSETIIPYRVHR